VAWNWLTALSPFLRTAASRQRRERRVDRPGYGVGRNPLVRKPAIALHGKGQRGARPRWLRGRSRMSCKGAVRSTGQGGRASSLQWTLESAHQGQRGCRTAATAPMVHAPQPSQSTLPLRSRPRHAETVVTNAPGPRSPPSVGNLPSIKYSTDSSGTTYVRLPDHVRDIHVTFTSVEPRTICSIQPFWLNPVLVQEVRSKVRCRFDYLDPAGILTEDRHRRDHTNKVSARWDLVFTSEPTPPSSWEYSSFSSEITRFQECHTTTPLAL
jgi:hypothetical protein